MQPDHARKPDAAELARRSIHSIPDHVFTLIINTIIGAFLLVLVLGAVSVAWHVAA